MAETRSDPAQPSRLEKKTNIEPVSYPGERSSSAAEFVRFFAEGWAAEKPDGFVAHFRARSHPELRLRQPLAPTARGPEGLERQFRSLFELFPDYAVTVEDWAASENAIYIRLTHSAGIGGRRVSWPGMDRIVLRDGQMLERDAYFDPTTMLGRLLTAPTAWPRVAAWLARAGLRR